MQKHTITLEIEVYAATAVAALGALVDRDLVFRVTTASGAQYDILAQRPIRGGIATKELATREAFPMAVQA